MHINKIKISVRELAEFLYLSGNLSGDNFNNLSAVEGIKIHQHYQKNFKKEDKEVYLEYELEYRNFLINIQGRIDCIDLSKNIKEIIEIKSTKIDISEFKEEKIKKEHYMQALFYAYIYALKNNLKKINIKMVYINIDTFLEYEKTYNLNFAELENEFFNSLDKYVDYLNRLEEYEINKFESIKNLKFPFDNFRKGQKEFMIHTLNTIKEKDILYAIAPTGIGKTISVLFSSIKSLKKYEEKIFYLTAKSSGKQIALNTLNLLKDKGLFIKSIEITNKEEMCLLKEKKCNPEDCIYARNYYDKLHESLDEMFIKTNFYDKSNILEFAKEKEICPFEFSLDLSYFADIIICDYNYAFDPKVHLIRYFDEHKYEPILLVDEAHNLVTRSREMYSNSFLYSDIVNLKKYLRGIKPYIKKYVVLLLNHLDIISDIENNFYFQDEFPSLLIEYLTDLRLQIEKINRQNTDYQTKEIVLEIYFKILDFLRVAEYYNDDFKFGIIKENDDIEFIINCLDASKVLNMLIGKNSIPTVFFSATMHPLFYYQNLLTNKGESLIINSPFDINNLKLIVKDIETTYNKRDDTIDEIIDLIKKTIKIKKGNYIIFFPSYEYLRIFKEGIINDLDFSDLLIYSQTQSQSLEDKLYILDEFRHLKTESQLGLFVMGGSFSEGIDYIGDMLQGVYILTVSLPMINEKNNLLLDFFDNKYKNGFDYAYLYPGLNKVIQAVGRVIRTEKDYGFAILIDNRFTKMKYRNLFPKEWKNYLILKDNDKIKRELEIFFKSKDPEDVL